MKNCRVMTWLMEVEVQQGLTTHRTHVGHIWDRFLRVK